MSRILKEYFEMGFNFTIHSECSDFGSTFDFDLRFKINFSLFRKQIQSNSTMVSLD